MSDIKVIADRDEIVAIADAVRSKTGTTGEMTLGGIVNGVNSITTQPNIQSLSITENGTYTAPTGVDGYSPVSVHVASSGGEVKLETWHGRIDSRDYTEVYYIDESGIGVQKSGFIEGTLELEIDVAANTYVIVEGFASSYALTFGCEIMGAYEYHAIGAYTFIIKPTGNNFRLVEQ